jgi:hypothetical protein
MVLFLHCGPKVERGQESKNICLQSRYQQLQNRDEEGEQYRDGTNPNGFKNEN